MARNTICPPCEMSDHKRHHRTVQAVSEGMMGGAVCTCKGECKDGRYKRHDPTIDALARVYAARAARLVGSRGVK